MLSEKKNIDIIEASFEKLSVQSEARRGWVIRSVYFSSTDKNTTNEMDKAIHHKLKKILHHREMQPKIIY